jgi:glutathione transport system ATP-binding protein
VLTEQSRTAPPAAGRPPQLALEVAGLTVSIPTENGTVDAVRSVSFSVRPGEVLGIVGESGSGKTMTALATMGLQPQHASVAGSVRVGDTELVGLDAAALRRVRGDRVTMIFQEPMSALNPMYTIGWQVGEVVRLHRSASRRAALTQTEELLRLVGMSDPRRVAAQYPHELSGGMRQRVMAAIAVANRPEVIIADEPTTALDVTVQANLLELLATLRAETSAAMVLITHDLGVVAGVADAVLVMYAGRVVEHAATTDIFARPSMPYTRGLLRSLPRLDRAGSRLRPIPGSPPSMIGLGTGCAFAPRCERAAEACATQPDLAPLGGLATAADHFVGCHFPDSGPLDEDEVAGPLERRVGAEVALAVRGLVQSYQSRPRPWSRPRRVPAVAGVDLAIHRGETLALVGESGCGKTTTARALLGLEQPEAGDVELAGEAFTAASDDRLRLLRARIQMVFQDPYASLNPRLPVRDIVAEPLVIHGRPHGNDEVLALLELVGLDRGAANRFPHEFSGGQRQRIGIARALALEPEVLVLDEPVSALDVSIQASVLNLLEDLQRDLGVAYLFIAHDLAVVRHIADRVAVMYLGKIVEEGDAGAIYSTPAHPYTKALLSAVPVPDPDVQRSRQRILLSGEVPSPLSPPSGCHFRTRCWKASALCAQLEPGLESLGPGHRVACHHPETA